jgi:hypothetical protein
MRTRFLNPKTRFPLALGASIGIGMPLFRGLTENLGPIVGLAVFLPAIALITVIFSFMLGAFTTTTRDAAAK